jgi:O-antigen biosynthesis protein
MSCGRDGSAQTTPATIVTRWRVIVERAIGHMWQQVRNLLSAGYRRLPLSSELDERLRNVFNPVAHWLDRQAHPRPMRNGNTSCSYLERDRLLEAYVTELFEGHTNDYVPFNPRPVPTPSVRVIALYLPQFHPIPENDRWWGRGFTEWANVARAKPQFLGHYQPRLPGELGFYDLRVIDVQRRQIELATQYGISGFCYHYYWFGFRPLLDMPLNQLLAHKELDFPFCLSWANENWTRRWDGRDDQILLAQHHAPDSDLAFIKSVESALRDERYIRVNGRPLLIVYRPTLLPEPKATTERWRDYCQRAGIGDLYLVSTHAFDRIPPEKLGFDAAMEFSPNNSRVTPITHQVSIVNPHYAGKVFDYRFLVEQSRQYVAPRYRLFRTVAPSWDNDPRKPGRGYTFVNSSPDLYRTWLENACRYTIRHFVRDERLVFINAWNEWAESAYLEPDRRYGYAYLEATADALRSTAANSEPTTGVE